MNNQPNRNIHCSVETCSHQCGESKCCTLDAITVGNTNKSAEHAAATECNSFEFAGELHPSMSEVKNRQDQKNSMGGNTGSGDGSLYGKNSMDANRTQKDY